jgi:uncharacterized protein YceH (UPF0502 family)
MSSPPETAAEAIPVLDADERRVLGVLVEKSKTTPDTYPMSINALVTGCNQKSNRDPLMDLSDVDVEEALVKAQKKGLAIKVTGGRVIRWRHALYEAWKVDKVELAVLAELLLRGPQTEGELRGRASRMEPIDDLDALRAVLRPLAQRRLVVYLTPEGRRGTVLTHGFHAADELERLRAGHVGEGAEEEPRPAAPPARPAAPERPGLEARLAGAEAELTGLRATVAQLQDELAALAAQVRALKEGLGM